MTRTDARACRPIILDPSRLTHLARTDPVTFRTPTPRTCSPTSLPSLTRELPVAVAMRWSPSWAWPPPRCWAGHGRSPRSPSGPPMRPSRSGPPSAPATTPPILRRPGRGHHRPDPFPPGRRCPGRCGRRLAGGAGPAPPRPAASRRRAVAIDGKTLRGARRGRRRRPPGVPAGLHGPRHPRGAGQRQVGGAPKRSPPWPHCWPTSTRRDRGHRRRAPDPPAGRLGSWSPASTPTTCWSSRRTSPPCWRAAPPWPGITSPCWTAPVTRPRPRRGPHPQGRQRRSLRLPPRAAPPRPRPTPTLAPSGSRSGPAPMNRPSRHNDGACTPACELGVPRQPAAALRRAARRRARPLTADRADHQQDGSWSVHS
jgi:hypothetical protein